MKLIDVERIIRQGAASLAESVHFYRPSSQGASGAAGDHLEANVTLHLGRGLLNASFLAYAEAHSEGQNDQRTDLLAIHPSTGALVIAEVKRLDGHGGTSNTLYDRTRLASFEPQDGARRHPGLRLDVRYGLLAGTSSNREYARWFTTMESSSIAPTPELAALHEQLPSDTIWNGYALSDVVDAAGQRRTQWLLYALFQVR